MAACGQLRPAFSKAAFPPQMFNTAYYDNAEVDTALLAALQGGCQVPLGAWARIERGELVLDACVCSVDGLQYVKQRATAPPDQAAQLGEHMAQVLIEAGAQSILEEVSRQRG